MFQSLWDKDQATLFQNMFFVIQTYFNFPSQITEVLLVSTEKSYDFVKIVRVSLNPIRIRPFQKPDNLCIKSSFYHLII